MDLTINLTLVIQIANFLVAYLLISKLLLRPGYIAVSVDTRKERRLNNSIVARQELIAHKQLYKADRWSLFQDHFDKQKPLLVDKLRLVHPLDEVQLPHLSKAQLELLSKELTAKIKPLVLQ